MTRRVANDNNVVSFNAAYRKLEGSPTRAGSLFFLSPHDMN